MPEETDNPLMSLKGYTFDGDTGRTLNDLYEAVYTIGGTKDRPFVRPFYIKGHERPAVVNAYLDPEGNRFHIIWYSDPSGLSHVDNIILDAASLAKEAETDSCDTCGEGIYSILKEIGKES
jgi:hypothetical protein